MVSIRNSFSIRGLNTAATLWCTAALVLRPLAQRINRTPLQAPEEIALYVFECICRTSDEAQIRALLLQNIGRTPLVLYALHSEDEQGASRLKVRAQVKSTGRKDEFLEQIVTRLLLEPGVTTIRWKIASALDIGKLHIVGVGPDSFDESQA